MTAPRLRQLYHLITSSSLCQVLFSIFFKIFFRLTPLRLPSNASSFPSLGRLSALFRLPSLCDSFAILAHTTPNVKSFFQFFSSFFILVESAVFPCTFPGISHGRFPLSCKDRHSLRNTRRNADALHYYSRFLKIRPPLRVRTCCKARAIRSQRCRR